MRYFIVISFLLTCISLAHSAAVSCVPAKVKVQNQNIILVGPNKSEPAQVYFLKNSSQQAIWIDHPVAHRSMSAGWSSYLRAGNWSAFLLNRKEFLISCSVIQPGKVVDLSCMKSLSVCTPKSATFKTPPKGAYWLVEDKSWDEMVKAVEKRGVGLT